jgi:fumarate reductase subunit D
MSALGATRASRAHPGFVAAIVHRLSGLALAIFLPAHFLSLGLAFEQDAFEGLVAWTNQPWVKVSEALLVAALAVHFAGGLRLLAIEFLGLTRAQAVWIAGCFAFGAGGGVLFLMGAF